MTTPTLSNPPPRTLEELKNDDCLKKGASIDGSSVGFTIVNQSDLKLKPDPSAIYELPSVLPANTPLQRNELLNEQALRRRVVVLCNLVGKDTGKPFGSDNRYMLQRTVDKYLTQNGYKMTFKIEPEFYLLDKQTKLPIDQCKYATLYPSGRGQAFIMDLSLECRKLNIPVQVLHHECGRAQYEIEMNHVDVLKQADNLVIFKNLAHVVADRHGMDINFMPKPFLKDAGSGQHIHMRMFRTDTNENVFGNYGKDAKQDEISLDGQSYVAGILKHIKAITAVANPTINSYKRMVPGFEAPTIACWGYRNRTALLRCPMFTTPNDAAMEIRSPDLLSNPYLLFSILIAAGVTGIKDKLTAPPPRTDDVFEYSEKELQEQGLETLPENLLEAIKEFSKDELMLEVFGEHNFEMFVKAKKAEWHKYIHHCITDWEMERYSNFM